MGQTEHFDKSFPAWRGVAADLFGAALILSARLDAAESADRVFLDGAGRMTALALEDEWVGIRTDLVVALPEWSRSVTLDPENVVNVTVSQDGKQRIYSGHIVVGAGATCAYRETVTENEAGVTLDIAVTADTDLDIDGVYLFLKLPIARFAGTPCTLATDGAVQGSATLPSTMEADVRFLKAAASQAVFGSVERARLQVGFDTPRDLWVQDERHWGGDLYTLFTRFCAGPLVKDQTASVRLTLALTGTVSHTPARLTVNPRLKLYPFTGFGGNFVRGIESPVTRYLLDQFRTAWARTQMSLTEWEPANDNESPAETNWAALEARDQAGTPLRREFELAQELQKRRISWCISVWELPGWLYTDPERGPGLPERRIAPDKWPELLEAIGSYLLYAKRHYGAEPDLFSFNAPNSGARVLLRAEEQRAAIKLIGAHFEKLGLKTKLLLGDVSMPRRSQAYIIPAAQDPAALRYVGAIGFHSWGGGSPDDYAAWAALAKDLNLPLLVTETGVDPEAWRTPAGIQSFHYALQELRLYQELLLYAAPRALMQWEFTNDYALVQESQDAAGLAVPPVPTWRFAFLKQFCNLTPPQATALGTASDQEEVLITAFAADAGGRRGYAFHIANLGPGRPATLEGMPLTVTRFRAVRTSQGEMFQELAPVEVRDGRAELTLVPYSLLTLTTFPVAPAAGAAAAGD